MFFDDFINELKNNFYPLPGNNAQLRLAPQLHLVTNVDEYNLNFARNSSVLILLFPDQSKISTVLIKRAEYPGVHSGQISFPGGKCEKTDSSIISTALREANEEIGITVSDIKIIGELTHLYIPRSNFIIYPVVSYTSEKPDFIVDKEEVNELILVDIDEFLNDNHILMKEFITSNKMSVSAPYYKINEHAVWGATAMIISEFVEIIKRTNLII